MATHRRSLPSLIAGLACLFGVPAVALANTPDLYDLKGPGGIKVSYATTSFTGKPTLHYVDGKTQLNFSGDDIRATDTEIGTLVTVTLSVVPDLQSITFTLLIPAYNLDGAEGPIETVGIWTTHRTSIGGPALVKGQQQTYQTVKLSGLARFVIF